MKAAFYLAVTTFVALSYPAIAGPDAVSGLHPKDLSSCLVAQSSSDASTVWPAGEVTHNTSKFTVGVTCLGTVGGFEFPRHSRISLLSSLRLEIGGIVNGDTLVSVASGWWDSYDPGRDLYLVWERKEFYPPDATYHIQRSLRPVKGVEGDVYRAVYVDTFTYASGFHWSLWGHTPLGLEVVQKSYSLDRTPYRNILLIDYSVTNIGSETIDRTYLGVFIDADVLSRDTDYNYGGWQDDLAGSFRDIATCYFIDNNGDAVRGRFIADTSTIDALAFRPTLLYPRPADTNFNWWAHYWSNAGYGPRMRGTPDDPFREFPGGVWGPPSDDSTRYYLMSHREWDYDQVLAPLISDDDPVWLKPDSQAAVTSARGNDCRATMSVGSYDLLPGQSFRVVFALFGAEFVHTDPENSLNLSYGRWQEFYDNLNFGILRSTAERAVTMTDLLLDPSAPPSSFELVRMSADTAFLKWDPWVFPDVVAYRVELEPLDDFFPAAPFAERSTSRLSSGQSVHYFPSEFKTGFVTGLEVGGLYVAWINHVLIRDVGAASPPLLVGYENEALQMPPVRSCREFAFFDDDDASVRINWEPVPFDDIQYYKIYRSVDSAEAFGRYSAFISSDTSGVPYRPVVCRDLDDATFCLYRMQAYDSVASIVTEYYDREPIDYAYYWITAVPAPNYESEFSDMIKGETLRPAEREIVVVLGATGSQSDYVYADSVTAFYDSVLTGYDYELYRWTDTNLVPMTCSTGYCTDWSDLAAFKLIVVEEYPSPKVLTGQTEPTHKLLTRLIDAGRHVAYFGTPPGDRQLTLNDDVGVIPYEPNSFEARYFHLDSSIVRSFNGFYTTYGSLDSLAGFNRAVPVVAGLPVLSFDTTRNCLKELINTLFDADHCLPYTPAFVPNQRAEVIYEYGSLYPETSELVGRPCGLLNRHDESRTYTFAFHLWAMNHADARELIVYMMTDPPQPTPPPLPRAFHLSQNYPNPFNQSTTISFNLSAPLQVELEIFNILGQRVRTLVNGYREAGPQSEVWDGRDLTGNEVSSGVYLYRLKTGERTDAKKMVLVR